MSLQMKSLDDWPSRHSLFIRVILSFLYHRPATSPPLATLLRASSLAFVLRISDPILDFHRSRIFAAPASSRLGKPLRELALRRVHQAQVTRAYPIAGEG